MVPWGEVRGAGDSESVPSPPASDPETTMTPTLLLAALLAAPAHDPLAADPATGLPASYEALFALQESSVRPGTASTRPTYEEYRRQQLDPRWRRGQAVLQGYLGAAKLNEVQRSGGTGSDMNGSGESLSQYPVIGGGAQWKLAGERIDLGLEAMFNIAWRSGGTAFAAGGGGATVAVKVDLWMVDLYGGPFVSLPLGRGARAYASAGPMMTFGEYRQGAADALVKETGSGFGTSVYGRFGVEFEIRSGTYLGLGARYQDGTIDLGSELGDLDVGGWQYVLTVTEGF